MTAQRRIFAICTCLVLFLTVRGVTASPTAKNLNQRPSDEKEASQRSRLPVTSFPSLRQDDPASQVLPMAPSVILYDQTDNPSPDGGFNSQNFEALYDSFDNQGAEDFLVTGSGWVVNTVITPGVYFNGTGPVSSVHVTFYDNAGGLPGAVIPGCDYPAVVPVGAATGSFTTTLAPGCTLTAGIKWVSVQANMNFLGGFGQWGWTMRSVQANNPSAWRNPGGSFPGGCINYTARTTCEPLTATSPDQLLRLDGTIASCTVDADCADGNLCNGVETCVANTCTPGTPVNCNDGLFCTTDSCNPGTGVCSNIANPCDDGNACTSNVCDEAGDACVNANVAIRLCNTASVTLTDSATPPTPASIYPTSIVVAGLGAAANLCAVELRGLTHTFADDIDMLLRAPGTVTNAIIMSDVGGGADITGINLTLSDSAATALPDAGPLVTGTFRPNNVNPGTGTEAWPAPAPAPTGLSPLSQFNGTNPNGTWSLYSVDDENVDAGSMTGGWCVNLVVLGCTVDGECNDGNACNGVETCVSGSCTAGTPINCDDSLFCTIDSCIPGTGLCAYAPNPCSDNNSCTNDSCDETNNVCVATDVSIRFCNAASITIPGSGAGTPYPSPIVIAGQPTVAAVCQVDLLGISHTFPDDVDVLLARNAGANALIMSDVGGSADVTNVNLVLRDSAALAIPDAGPLVSGTFRPTNIGAGDAAFPAPAPAISGPSLLSTFDGQNPNGTWNLWVRDEFAPDAGTMSGGWCMNIVVSPCTTNAECADGNVCNGVETCDAGVCTPGTPIDCSDGLFCTLDTCDPPTGTCGNPPNLCGDGSACTSDSCNEATDMCVYVNRCTQVCNSGAITVNDGATPPAIAGPYPSTISVSGATGIFSLASVELRGLSHSFPNDIDILLIAPNTPDTATIMSDVGGTVPAVGATLTLADGNPAIPGTGPLMTGTYAPTNVNPGTGTEAWPAPAPVPGGGVALSQFDGTDPNGDWVLYVVDDQTGDSGSIAGGWCLNYLATCTTAAECDDFDPCTTDTCTNSICAHSALGTPGLATAVEASNDKQTYTWTASTNATRHDIVRGALSAFPVGPGGADEVCFNDEPAATLSDPATPAPPGAGFFYVVRGDNDCTAGSYGTESNATPRLTATCP